MNRVVGDRSIGCRTRNAGPGGGGDGVAAIGGGQRDAGIDLAGQRLPDVEHAFEDAHAGVGLQRDHARIVALVGRARIHVSEYARWGGRAFFIPQAGRCSRRGNGSAGGVVIATASHQRKGGSQRNNKRQKAERRGL